jgi:hypothetical protein
MRVKALTNHDYGVPMVRREIGEEYDMDPKFYEVMSRSGHVVSIEESPVIRTRDLESEPPKQYRRRDLQSKK